MHINLHKSHFPYQSYPHGYSAVVPSWLFSSRILMAIQTLVKVAWKISTHGGWKTRGSYYQGFSNLGQQTGPSRNEVKESRPKIVSHPKSATIPTKHSHSVSDQIFIPSVFFYWFQGNEWFDFLSGDRSLIWEGSIEWERPLPWGYTEESNTENPELGTNPMF